MRAVICDRCGARIENQDTVGFVGLARKAINTDTFVGKNDFKDWDFCDDCMEAIEKFVRMKPDTARPRVNPVLVNKFRERVDAVIAEQQEEEEHDAADRPKATIKKPAPARITPEQIEQIRTLVTEGHSVGTIAELVGVSAPTVRKYKKEMEDVGGEE